MAESKMPQNIDKLAYAVAGVLGVALLALAGLSDRGLASAVGDLDKSMRSIEVAEEEQQNLDSGRGPATVGILDDQWRFERSVADVSWSVERAPLIVRKQKAPEPVPAVLEPVRICQIELARDSERMQAYLRVNGQLSPNNKFVNILEIQLFRSVDGGDFERVRNFRGERGDFVYEDRDVEPGKTYAYRTTVRAETIDSRLHPLSRSVLQSAVCGPTPPIPLDVYLSVTAITADATGEPGATVRVRYFDYTKGDYEAKASVSVKQRDFIDPATERFQIFQIDSQRQVIVVRDNKVRRGMKLEFGAGATKVRYRPEDIQAWDPLECCTGAEAAVEGEVIEETDASATLDASADEASAAPEPTESEPMETESEPDTTEPESTPTGGSGRRPRF